MVFVLLFGRYLKFEKVDFGNSETDDDVQRRNSIASAPETNVDVEDPPVAVLVSGVAK